MKTLLWISGLFLLGLFQAQAQAYLPEIENLTLGREFSAAGYPRITPVALLTEIQKTRGGEIRAHRTTPGKWNLIDSEGLKWGAEQDGKLPSGEVILEIQTPPLKANQADLMTLPLQAYQALGAKPRYSVGGGHIHIDVARYFEKYPNQFASLINFLLNHEELLTYVFANPRREFTIRRISSFLHPITKQPLSQYLGQRLNHYLNSGDENCESDIATYAQGYSPSSCILGLMEYFARDVIPGRETNINLQAWKGSSAKKTHGTLELRFFNAPQELQEAVLEEKLVRAIADLAARSDRAPISYAPLVDPLLGESSYYNDQTLQAHFDQMLSQLGMTSSERAEYRSVYLERLKVRRHPGN